MARISAKTREDFRTAARDQGTAEVDEGAKVSVSDNGAYVQAWIWVSNSKVGRKVDHSKAYDNNGNLRAGDA